MHSEYESHSQGIVRSLEVVLFRCEKWKDRINRDARVIVERSSEYGGVRDGDVLGVCGPFDDGVADLL